ncbi:MAG: hypothetical protein CL916_02255 [Deltaproteobacteria bacterium]|nr:hypothetical protein [Deltaproteobacteria bacterium]
MKRVAQKGFTLLEITIALAILTISIAILIDSQGSVAWMLEDTNNVRVATLLAEEKMTEAHLFLEEEGWKDSDIEENGDFSDFGAEDWRQGNLRIEDKLDDFKWAYTIRRIELTLPSQLGSLAEDLGSSGYFGDQQSEDVQNNTLDLGDLGISPEMITEYLSGYIREIRVRIWWGADPEGEEQLEILTHVINPSGVVTETGDQEGQQ